MVNHNEQKKLSRQAMSLWAKTGGKDSPQMWEPLVVHMADSGEIARLLWRDWVSASTKRFICEELQMNVVQAETLMVFLGSIHDIGKATPSFASKVENRSEWVQATGLRIAPKTNFHSHAFMGERIIKRHLANRGWNENEYAGLSAIVGGHHGANATEDDLDKIDRETRMNPLASMGDESWAHVQDELLEWAFAESGTSREELQFKNYPIPPYVQVLLVGIVIMADWIASNANLFPLTEGFGGWGACRARAEKAWKVLNLPRPIALDTMELDEDELFHARFVNLPTDAKLRPIQQDAFEMVRCSGEPQLIIIEAQMGDGKTEAALLCAEVLAQRFGAGGIAFLLPTQATSNAMFGRVKSWLRQLLLDQQGAQAQDIHLLHGKAALNEDYTSLPTWGIGWTSDDEADKDTLGAHQWFSGSKRGLLAPFVVGTVDQLLMASLRTKHAHLRHLGLAGKVVIIDEVHAYDAYMSTYLDRVLTFLSAYKVPVILLSATLPPSRRADLQDAYRGNVRKRFGRKRKATPAPKFPSGDPVYPLISTVSGCRRAEVAYGPVRIPSTFRKVSVRYLNDDDEQLVALLESELNDGGCVCVLRNTVRRAQETYRLLKEQFGDDVMLAHSRFIAIDRAARDAELNNLLGRNQTNRPKRLVLVGTQVLEQSLDIDLDLLITDIAPVDLLLQRMGRLHRHERGENQSLRPLMLREARCYITGVDDWSASVPQFARGMTSVYEQAILLRTIAALGQRVTNDGQLMLPIDIAPLVECVYEEKASIPGAWESVYEDALRHEQETMRRKKDSATQWLLAKPGRVSLDGWMQDRVSITDENRGRAAVRDTEESLEVVVVEEDVSGYKILPWVAEHLGADSHLGTGADTPPDELARVAALCTVCLPPDLSSPRNVDDVIRALLKQFPCMGWEESRWLRGQIPLALNSKGEAVISCSEDSYLLKYSRELGIETQKL